MIALYKLSLGLFDSLIVEYSHLCKFLNPSLKIFLDFTVIPVLLSGKLFSLDWKLYSCTVFFCRNGFWKMDRIKDSNRQAKTVG
jgi:hypothetical protein